jgi:hypothetical protein
VVLGSGAAIRELLFAGGNALEDACLGSHAMPTHRDLPSTDLDDDPERRGGQTFGDPGHRRRRRKRRTRARALLAAVLVVVFASLEVVVTRTGGQQGPGLRDEALRAVPTRNHAAGRHLGALEPQQVFAVGYSVPRSGRAPHLLAFAYPVGSSSTAARRCRLPCR